MRHIARLGASRRYVFLPVVVLIFSFMLGRTAHGQAPGASSAQLEQGVASPALPAAWNDGVKALAEKIVAAVKPSRAVSLEFKNISSLGASEVEAVRAGLEKELTSRWVTDCSRRSGRSDAFREQRWLRLGGGGPEEYEEGGPSRVAIVLFPDPRRRRNGTTESLALSRLVWQQPTEFFGFRSI